MQPVGHHSAIEDQLLELAETAEYETLSSEARILTKELLAEGHDRTQLLDAYELTVTRLYGKDLAMAKTLMTLQKSYSK